MIYKMTTAYTTNTNPFPVIQLQKLYLMKKEVNEYSIKADWKTFSPITYEKTILKSHKICVDESCSHKYQKWQ